MAQGQETAVGGMYGDDIALRRLAEIEGVESAVLVSYNGDYMG